MAERVAVAWLERPSLALRWCRAASKRSTSYQDHVRTRCGFVITLPCGLSHEQPVDCENCNEMEVQK